MSNIKNEIKLLLIHKEITMSELVRMINERFDKEDTVQNLNNKLARGTIKFSEIKEIADVLDYKLAWIPSNNDISVGTNGVFFSTQIDEIKHQQKGKSLYVKRIKKEPSE